MERKFNPKITEIKSIGDELRFQREYYNFKNPRCKYTKKTNNGKKSKFIGDELNDFLQKNFSSYKKKDKYNSRDNFGEYGYNEDIIDAIENGRNRNEERDGMFYPERYYLRMYSLFKIYGFLEDYEIIMLLEGKYNIKPDFKKTQQEIEKIKERCFYEYKVNANKSAFNIKLNYMIVSQNICNELAKDFNHFNFLCSQFNINSLKDNNNRRNNFNFTKLKKQMKEKFNILSEIEKKCISLELGKETNFINDILQDKIKYVTIDTILRILYVLNLQNTDLEYILKKEIERTQEKEVKECNILDIEKDIFKFREM